MVARENARAVRESISSEMWEHINRFYLLIRESGAQQAALQESYDFFDQIRVSGQQFMGVTDATMTHGEGWHFCRLARSMERADKTSRILDVKYFILLPSPADVGSPYDDIQWSALLRSASALEMYRQRHGRLDPADVVQFLVLDREFPRAVLYNLTKANESLHAISGTAMGAFANRAEQHLGPAAGRAGLYLGAADHPARAARVRRRSAAAAQRGGRSVHESFFALRPLEMMQQSQRQYQEIT